MRISIELSHEELSDILRTYAGARIGRVGSAEDAEVIFKSYGYGCPSATSATVIIDTDAPSSAEASLASAE